MQIEWHVWLYYYVVTRSKVQMVALYVASVLYYFTMINLILQPTPIWQLS
jgi:hypothetical protein